MVSPLAGPETAKPKPTQSYTPLPGVGPILTFVAFRLLLLLSDAASLVLAPTDASIVGSIVIG
jgi:hypothetical protein